MPALAIELTFADGGGTYPAGTPVTFCPPGDDDEGFYLHRRVKELTEANKEPYRIVMLGGMRRLLPQRIIVSNAAEAAGSK